MIIKRELRMLREVIRSYWEQGLDTSDMARALQISEATVDRELHGALEIRRSILAVRG